MARRLGDKHPEMIKQRSAIESTDAKLSAEISKVVQSVHNEFLSAQAQEESLAQALEAQKNGRPVAESEGHRVRSAAA